MISEWPRGAIVLSQNEMGMRNPPVLSDNRCQPAMMEFLGAVCSGSPSKNPMPERRLRCSCTRCGEIHHYSFSVMRFSMLGAGFFTRQEWEAIKHCEFNIQLSMGQARRWREYTKMGRT